MLQNSQRPTNKDTCVRSSRLVSFFFSHNLWLNLSLLLPRNLQLIESPTSFFNELKTVTQLQTLPVILSCIETIGLRLTTKWICVILNSRLQGFRSVRKTLQKKLKTVYIYTALDTNIIYCFSNMWAPGENPGSWNVTVTCKNETLCRCRMLQSVERHLTSTKESAKC